MASTLRIAWRNLGRNRRRTAITSVALGLGMALCVASYGWWDGVNREILRALTRLDLGHVQVHDPEYPARRTLRHTLTEPARVLAAARRLSTVEGASARVYGFALASEGTKSAGVELVGISPASEPGVTDLLRTVIAGRALDASPTPWPAGRALSSEEQARDAALTERAEAEVLAEIDHLSDGGAPSAVKLAAPAGRDELASSSRALARQIDPPPARPPRVLVGATLAKVLGLRVGSRPYLMSQTVDGMTAETAFEVAGLFRTGTDYYDRRVLLHLADLQRFLRLGEGVHEVSLRVRDSALAPTVARDLGARLPGALVRSWDVIRPDVKNMLQINDVAMALTVFIIFIVAALGVVNTMLMAVFERTRELGMLKALGMSGGRVLWMILVETTLLVLVGSFFGIAVGLGLDLYMIAYGLDLSAFTEGISYGGLGVPAKIYGVITPAGILVPLFTLGGMCFLAAFYPAARAARLRPAQGMREA